MSGVRQCTTLVLKSELTPTEYATVLEGTFYVPLNFDNTPRDLDDGLVFVG